MGNDLAVSALTSRRELVRRLRFELNTLPSSGEALSYAARLLNSYPAAGRDDGAKGFVRQLEKLLAGYPVGVLEQLIHPRYGVPGAVQGFPFPQLSQIREMADALVDRRAEQLRACEAGLQAEEDRIERINLSPEERERRHDMLKAIAKELRSVHKKTSMLPAPTMDRFGYSKAEQDAARLESLARLSEIPIGSK